MRIALIIPTLAGGGAEFVARQWSRELKRRGHDVLVLITEDAKDLKTTADDPPIHSLHSRAGALGQIGKLLQLQRHHSTDVVLSLMPYWNLLSIVAAALMRSRRPALVISERTLVMAFRTTKGRAYAAKILLARLLYRRADACIAISHPVASEVASIFCVPLSRIWVVPNPALAKVAQPLQPRSDSQVRRQPLAAIVVPCRLVDQKRPELAIDVAAFLKDQGVHVSVHYFGSGPMQEDLEGRGAAAGVDFRFHGWVENWFEEVPSGSVVLLPSVVEGFGNVLVEAAASGIPCVATSRALGVADAMVNGMSGVLTSGESVAEFASAVRAATHLSMQSLHPWLANFTIENSVNVLENCLTTIVTSRKDGVEAQSEAEK